MEAIHEITYDGVKYTVNEPTLDIWTELMAKKDWVNDFDLAITILSWVTGLSYEEVRDADSRSIINAADGIVEYFTTQSEEFFDTFTLGDKTYKFIDLPNLSFGEYIDIDDLLNKPVTERHKNLPMLMALLYRELDDKGNYLPYDIDNVKLNALKFRKLPIKYVKGATVFFYLMETISVENTPFYIHQKAWWVLRWRLMKRKWRKIRGGGTLQFTHWLRKISLMLKK